MAKWFSLLQPYTGSCRRCFQGISTTTHADCAISISISCRPDAFVCSHACVITHHGVMCKHHQLGSAHDDTAAMFSAMHPSCSSFRHVESGLLFSSSCATVKGYYVLSTATTTAVTTEQISTTDDTLWCVMLPDLRQMTSHQQPQHSSGHTNSNSSSSSTSTSPVLTAAVAVALIFNAAATAAVAVGTALAAALAPVAVAEDCYHNQPYCHWFRKGLASVYLWPPPAYHTSMQVRQPAMCVSSLELPTCHAALLQCCMFMS